MQDYQTLTGSQRAVLAETIGEICNRRALNRLLDAADLPHVEDIVAEDGFEFQLPPFLHEMQKRNRLGVLIAELRDSDYGEHRALVTLDDRLVLAAPTGGAAPANRKAERAQDRELQQPKEMRGPAAWLVGRTKELALGAKMTNREQERELQRMVRASGLSHLHAWTETLMTRGMSVCRISYAKGIDEVNGTGILISPSEVITNFHVIEALTKGHADPGDVRIAFRFAEIDGELSVGPQARLAADWLGHSAPYAAFDLDESPEPPSDGELDFAVLRLSAPVAGIAPQPLVNAAEAPQPGAIVVVLQHPEGQPIQQSMGVVSAQQVANRLRYGASTLSGSSGALVLDDKLRPVALHHAGDPNFERMARYNQGVPLTLIRAALAETADA